MFWKHPEIAKRWTKRYPQDLKKLPEKAAETVRVNAFFDELDKIAVSQKWRGRMHRGVWRGVPASAAALGFGYGLTSIMDPMKREIKRVTTSEDPRWKKEVVKSKYLVPYAIASGLGITGGKGMAEEALKKSKWLRRALKLK